MMNPEVKRIYEQFLDGRCSRAEAERLLDYFRSNSGYADMVRLVEQELDKELSEDEYEAVEGFSPIRGIGLLTDRIKRDQTKTYQTWRWIPYAAAVLFIVSFGVFWYADQTHTANQIATAPLINDVPPGGNRAVLTMSDGRRITLDESQSGIMMDDKNITYTDGSVIESSLTAGVGIDQTRVSPLLSLTTPKGGTYHVILPDGSKVWLNAGSKLRYPTHFSNTERVVELEGEAYFDVAGLMAPNHDGNVPFKVVSRGQLVEVFGTEFNISAYSDVEEVRTTLVKGMVKVFNDSSYVSSILSPGHQATVRGADLVVDEVDVKPFVSWKSGMFHFKNTPLSEVMSQVARWYDVEVQYQGNVSNEKFGGRVRRDVSLLTFLELLEASEIEYYIDGKSLVIK